MKEIIKELEKHYKESREHEKIKKLLDLCLKLIRSKGECAHPPLFHVCDETVDYLSAEIDLIKFVVDF